MMTSTPALRASATMPAVPLPPGNDIDRLNQTAKERLGYPTQKPVALLDRIIQASSKPGDVILDPFCGCETSLESAQKNGRNWIGIDIAHYAMTLIEGRLKAKYPTVGYSVYGTPDGSGRRARTGAS
jgi:DNA modification methylase